MEKNNWARTTKFFKLKITFDKIYGNKKDIQMDFQCDNLILRVPKDENGKLKEVLFDDCVQGKYGESVQNAAMAMIEKSELFNEPLEKLKNEFTNAQSHFINDINRIRSEAKLPLV